MLCDAHSLAGTIGPWVEEIGEFGDRGFFWCVRVVFVICTYQLAFAYWSSYHGGQSEVPSWWLYIQNSLVLLTPQHTIFFHLYIVNITYFSILVMFMLICISLFLSLAFEINFVHYFWFSFFWAIFVGLACVACFAWWFNL